MVSATSPTLLLLCGDMRCYRLLETPLDSHLKVNNNSQVVDRQVPTPWVSPLPAVNSFIVLRKRRDVFLDTTPNPSFLMLRLRYGEPCSPC